MLNDVEQKNFKEALCYYLSKNNVVRELRIVEVAEMSFDYLNTDFGIDYFTLSFKISPVEFVEYAEDIDQIQSNLTNSSKLFLKDFGSASLSHVLVSPKLSGPLLRQSISPEDKQRLMLLLNDAKSVLIGVSTGGPRIQEKNDGYILVVNEINSFFMKLGLGESGLFKDLWAWYGIWSSGSYPSYQSRRVYISDLIAKIIEKIERLGTIDLQDVESTGVQRLDRSVREIRYRYSEASNEEQFQAIGVLCRESLITLAQMAFNAEKHMQYCDIAPSSTDTKRMLDAFIQSELVGSTNEILRRFAKSANDLANELTHRRTASKKDTVICINATFSIINIVYALMNKVDNTSI